MTEQEIFGHLFELSTTSDDTGGVVTSCLVRNGTVFADGVSTASGVHSEHALLKALEQRGERIAVDDIIYTTVEPCGRRTPGGPGEKMGDCTTNLLRAGVKHVVYAAADPEDSGATRHKFEAGGCELRQVKNDAIIARAVEVFNASCSDGHKPLPAQNLI